MIQIHPKVEQMGGVKWTLSMTQEAARAAKQHQEAMNKSFRFPQMLKEDEETSVEKAIHIFNVGPFADRVFLGDWGDVRIPECPRDKDYVYVCNVPGIYLSFKPGEGEYVVNRISGKYVAQEILGEGPDLKHFQKNNSRRPIGVFIGSVVGPTGSTPLASEVEAAREAVRQHLHELVLEANGAWGLGQKQFEMVVSTKHYMAAQLTENEDLEWYKNRNAPAKKAPMIPCPACQEQKKESAVVCAKCGYKDRLHPNYEALFGEFKAPVPATPTPVSTAPVKSAEELEVERLRTENAALAAKKGK